MAQKRVLVTAAVAAIVGLATVGVGGAAIVNAQSGDSDQTLVERIASTFNLDTSKVQAVFDAERDEQQAARQAEFSERLQDAVDDGDITADQKTKIEAKVKELQAAMQTQRDELETWAEDNDVDVRYVMGGPRGGNDDTLQGAVDDGDITADQKTKIEAKQKELDTEREAARDELEAWAEDNDIDMQYLHVMGGGHGGPGRGGERE